MEIEKLLMTKRVTEELIADLNARIDKVDKAIDKLGYEICDGCGEYIHGNDALLKGTTRSYVIMCCGCYHGRENKNEDGRM